MVLDLFKKWLGGADTDAQMRRDVAGALNESRLDIEAALMAHQNWKLRLTAYLEGRSAEDLRAEVICFDDRCDLGKWIHGPGVRRLGRYPGFTALRENHRMFHYSASNVVAVAQAGRREEAERLLRGVYADFSHRVIEELRALRALGGRRTGPERARQR